MSIKHYARTAFVGGSTLVVGGGPADVKHDMANDQPPAQVIKQEVESKRNLLSLLKNVAAYKRYDHRDYTEAWDMLNDASKNSERNHIGFVRLTEEIGEVVGAAADAGKKLPPDLIDAAIRRFYTASGKITGLDPFQVAMQEVPASYRPADGFSDASATYREFQRDVIAARKCAGELGYNKEPQMDGLQQNR